MSRHAPLLDRLRRAVIDGPGVLDVAVRRAAHAGGPLPEPQQTWIDRVRGDAAGILDDHLVPLRAAGLSDDAVFELTVTAAVGAADLRLAAANAALGRK